MRRPRHARDTAVDGAVDDPGTVHAPGVAALVRRALRRHPQFKRNAAVGSIVAGVAVFAAASLSTSFASADTHSHGVDAMQATGINVGALLALAGSGSSTAAAPDPVLTGQPVHVRKPVRVTKAAITGLASNGIPNVALNAYRVAAARIDHVDPGCGLDWALLAGIGRVESDHGRFGGAVLNSDGTTSPRIIGPALDGIHWDYVPAPANGEQLDGDAVYAHALGPMQFIPQTWAAFGADANGDGVADVFNINDAALGAARYLCAAGGDLRTTAGQTRAVLTYNHSDKYLAEVLALADAYRRGINITGIPVVGNTSGSLSPVRTTDVPPANPGGPTALQPRKTGTTGHKSAHAGSSPAPAGGSKTSGSGASTPPAGSTATLAPPIAITATPPSPSPAPPSSTAPAPTPSSTPPPPASSSPAPSPSPTKKCVIPDPFDKTKCWA